MVVSKKLVHIPMEMAQSYEISVSLPLSLQIDIMTRSVGVHMAAAILLTKFTVVAAV